MCLCINVCFLDFAVDRRRGDNLPVTHLILCSDWSMQLPDPENLLDGYGGSVGNTMPTLTISNSCPANLHAVKRELTGKYHTLRLHVTTYHRLSMKDDGQLGFVDSAFCALASSRWVAIFLEPEATILGYEEGVLSFKPSKLGWRAVNWR